MHAQSHDLLSQTISLLSRINFAFEKMAASRKANGLCKHSCFCFCEWKALRIGCHGLSVLSALALLSVSHYINLIAIPPYTFFFFSTCEKRSASGTKTTAWHWEERTWRGQGVVKNMRNGNFSIRKPSFWNEFLIWFMGMQCKRFYFHNSHPTVV